LVITLNCLDGYWMLPPKFPGYTDSRSMAEVMTMAPDYGSIANFSPAGLGTTPAEELIARQLYDTIFNDGGRRLGEIALAGQLTPVGYPPHLPEVSTLFGDPAGVLRLRLPSRQWTIIPHRQNGSGPIGGEKVYVFQVTNNGDYADHSILTTSSGGWPLGLSTTQTKQIMPGEYATVAVTVTIPANAAVGQKDTAYLFVTSGAEPQAQDKATIITTATERQAYLYLPVVLRRKGGP
jgi:hypothetical protein